MMKKEEISEILIHLWHSVDQAGYDYEVDKAFRNCPVKIQKQFIELLVYNNNWDIDVDEEILLKGKKLVGMDDE